MTIQEAIARTDALVFNTCTAQQKVQWLSKLDLTIHQQILQTHAGMAQAEFSGYDADTDRQTVLLVPAPYDSVYLRWLEAQIHYHTGEYTRYNNAITLFNTEYTAFSAHCSRRHTPLCGKRFHF